MQYEGSLEIKKDRKAEIPGGKELQYEGSLESRKERKAEIARGRGCLTYEHQVCIVEMYLQRQTVNNLTMFRSN